MLYGFHYFALPFSGQAGNRVGQGSFSTCAYIYDLLIRWYRFLALDKSRPEDKSRPGLKIVHYFFDFYFKLNCRQLYLQDSFQCKNSGQYFHFADIYLILKGIFSEIVLQIEFFNFFIILPSSLQVQHASVSVKLFG